MNPLAVEIGATTRNQQMLDLRKSGLNNAEIGRRYGLTGERVRVILSQYDETVPSPGQGMPRTARTKNCEACGRPFAPKKKDAAFCSVRCLGISKQRPTSKATRHGYLELTCDWCGNKFLRITNRQYIADSQGCKNKFCCREHYWLWKRRGIRVNSIKSIAQKESEAFQFNYAHPLKLFAEKLLIDYWGGRGSNAYDCTNAKWEALDYLLENPFEQEV